MMKADYRAARDWDVIGDLAAVQLAETRERRARRRARARSILLAAFVILVGAAVAILFVTFLVQDATS